MAVLLAVFPRLTRFMFAGREKAQLASSSRAASQLLLSPGRKLFWVVVYDVTTGWRESLSY